MLPGERDQAVAVAGAYVLPVVLPGLTPYVPPGRCMLITAIGVHSLFPHNHTIRLLFFPGLLPPLFFGLLF